MKAYRYYQYIPESKVTVSITLPQPLEIQRFVEMLAGLNRDVHAYGCIYFCTPASFEDWVEQL
jgi:hypothetical protein